MKNKYKQSVSFDILELKFIIFYSKNVLMYVLTCLGTLNSSSETDLGPILVFCCG